MHQAHSPAGCGPNWHTGGGGAAEGKSGPDSSVSVYLRLQEATQQLLKVNIQWGMCENGARDRRWDVKTDRTREGERERERERDGKRERGDESENQRVWNWEWQTQEERERIMTPSGVCSVEAQSSVRCDQMLERLQVC